MPGEYMICMVISGNGARIGMGATLPVQFQIPQAHQRALIRSLGAAVGIFMAKAVGQRAVTPTPPGAVNFFWDFVWLGKLDARRDG